MRHEALSLVLPLLAAAACTPSAKAPPGAPMAAAPTASVEPVSPAVKPDLTGYRWVLEAVIDAEGRRVGPVFSDPTVKITMVFADGELSLSGGCNTMIAPFALTDDARLSIAPAAATIKACAPERIDANREVNMMMSLAEPHGVRVEPGSPPHLYLSRATAEASVWRGEPSLESRYGAAEASLYFEVAPTRAACHHPHNPDHQCLYVREVHYDAAGVKQWPSREWRPLYEPIEGFELQEGERQVVLVKSYKRNPAPADASSIVYVYEATVESEAEPPMAR